MWEFQLAKSVYNQMGEGRGTESEGGREREILRDIERSSQQGLSSHKHSIWEVSDAY